MTDKHFFSIHAIRHYFTSSIILIFLLSNSYNVYAAYPSVNIVLQDDVEALKQKAEQGDVQAQYNMGMLYEQGKGVPKSYTEAAKWLKKAADNGFVQAQLRLAYYYEVGAFTDMNYVEAARYYNLAAQQGNAQAMNTLGRYYMDGLGVKKDLNKAKDLFEGALKGGNREAENNLKKLQQLLPADAVKTSIDTRVASKEKNTEVASHVAKKKDMKPSVESKQPVQDIGTPMGIIDEDDLSAAGIETLDTSDQYNGIPYPKGMLKSIFVKSLDEKGKIGGEVFWGGVILLILSLWGSRYMMNKSGFSFRGVTIIIGSFLFAGTMRGFFARYNFFGDWFDWVMIVLLIVGVYKCITGSEGLNKLWAVLGSLVLGFVIYHTAMITFFISGWLLGGICMAFVTGLFMHGVLKIELSSRGRSGGGTTFVDSSSEKKCNYDTMKCRYYGKGQYNTLACNSPVYSYGKEECPFNGYGCGQCQYYKDSV